MASIDVQTTRLSWIDQLRGFLMFMVFLTHLHSPLWLRQFMYPIFLTGFFTLSGYLYKPKPLKQHLYSVFNTLLVPFLLYSIIIATIEFVKYLDITVFIQSFYNNFILGGDQFWFIPCLIIVEILFYIFKCYFTKDNHTAILFALSVAAVFLITDNDTKHHLPWNVDTALWSLAFYILGGANIFKKVISNIFAYGFALLYVCLCFTLGIFNLDCGTVDMHMNYIQHPISYMLLAIVGCYALIHVFPLLPNSRLFTALGKYTLFAFPFQPYILRIFEKISRLIIPNGLYDQFYALIIVVIAFATSAVFACVGIFLSRYIPILLGKVKILK